jgi:signal transduction histidine kinase
MSESLRKRLLKSIGHDLGMRAALAGMMERTHAEFCALYTARGRELAYIMLESRELSPRIPEIRDKLMATYRMFTNGASPESEPIEKIYWRRNESTVEYLLGDATIKSYFLVPVIFGSKVRGVLFFGSIRKEAFGRNDIAVFQRLADEGEEKSPLMFRLGGEKEILERMLEALPTGAALVSPDGRIVSVNKAFMDVLQLDGDLPETVYDVGKVSRFNLRGIWEEFGILQRNVIDRELEGVGIPERYLSVTWVRLGDLSEEVASLVLLRDSTASREQAEAREEMIAMVAHELRTPLTALKSSLSILADLGGQGNGEDSVSRGSQSASAVRTGEAPTASRERFLSNAIRTIDRLGRLVDALIDSSAARVDEREFKAEPHHVREFLSDISALFIEPMRKKGIDFTIDINKQSSVLTFDKDRMEQVIQNLLANSIKHVPGGGDVSISVNPCDACPEGIIPVALRRYLPRAVFAELCLSDSGSGIPHMIADRVNEGGTSSERPARASKGLGLIIAKRLVRLHGGSLVVEEGRPQGSGVHLFLPVDQETIRVVQTYRIVETKVDELIARGRTPTVYCMSKRDAPPWPKAAQAWRWVPAITPARSEVSEGSVFLWPLTEEFALALTARIEFAEAPEMLLAERGPAAALRKAIAGAVRVVSVAEDGATAGHGVRAGWAVAPREGAHLKELLPIALKRMERALLAPMMKGDAA